MTRYSIFCASTILSAFIFIQSGTPADASGQDRTLTARELVARHLRAIGPPEARAAVRNRALNGSVTVVFRLGSHGRHEGKFSFLSEGNKVRLGMRFSNTEYAGEQLAYDGKNSSTGFTTLASVFYQYDYILKQGLLCGGASLAWPLLEVDERQPMLEYGGVTKIEGQRQHELKYRAKTGDQGFSVTMYFDADTYLLTRSKYALKIGHLIGPTDLISARQAPTFLTILEDFGEYKTIDGVALPHLYKLTLNLDRKDNSILSEWTARVHQVFHNRNLDPKYFIIK
jgi:hypothetical protein